MIMVLLCDCHEPGRRLLLLPVVHIAWKSMSTTMMCQNQLVFVLHSVISIFMVSFPRPPSLYVLRAFPFLPVTSLHPIGQHCGPTELPQSVSCNP